MKKYILFFMLITSCAFADNSKLTELPETGTNIEDDLLYVVTDTSGTATSKKIAAGNVSAGSLSIDGSNCESTNYKSGGIDRFGNAQDCTLLDPAVTLTGNSYLTITATSQAITMGDVTLGTHSAGNYVSSVTENQGLLLTGSEGASVGLKACADGEILKNSSGTSWNCSTDNATPPSSGAPTTATYIVMSTDTTLTVERVLTAGDGMESADAGAGGTFTLAVNLMPATNGVGTTSSASGMEFISGELSNLQGCANNELLKFRESDDKWYCAPDLDSGGTIAGTDTQVMFFDGANTPSGDAGMTFNKTTNVLTLTGSILVPDSTYGTSWNGALFTPPANAIYDKIAAVEAAGIGSFTDWGDVASPTDTTANFTVGGTICADSPFCANLQENTFKAEGGLKTGNGVTTTQVVLLVDLPGTDLTLTYEHSDGTLYSNYPFGVTGTGGITANGTLIAENGVQIGSETASLAACISNSSDHLYHDTDCDQVKDAGENFID